jgi:hypothetical protein
MNYESGNVYVYLTFRTPIDVNTTTGLYDFSQVGEESPFGGIYRIVLCENTFADGGWKQKLKCVRMPGPQGPETVKTVKAINPETGEVYDKVVTNKSDVPAIAVGPKEPPKTSVVDNSASSSTTVGADKSNSDSVSGQRASADPRRLDNKATTTTSNQAPPVVGFRYYRDLGQR